MPIKSITRYITLGALFLVPFFPLIVANSFFFPFITGKAFFFRIVVEIAFAGWILLAFMDAKYRPKLNAMTIAVTVFAIVTLVADLLGVNPLRSIMSNFERMEGWLVVFHLWMFFMAIAYTFGSGEEGKRMWFRWLNISLVVAFYIACRGALQWAGKIAIQQSASRPDSTLGNAAYLAVYMLMHSGIAAYLFLSTQLSRKALVAAHHRTVFIVREWIYALLATFFGIILFATATRGAIIGYVGGILLALALYAIFGGSKGSSHDSSKHIFSTNTWRMISGGIIVLVLLAGFLVWSNRDSALIKSSETFSRLTSISLSQFKTEGRSYIWPMAIKGAMQRPVLGWGQENFNYIFNTNYDPHMWGQEQWFDRAHSVYLDWLVASGFVGLVAYLALYVLFLVVVWKSSAPVSIKSLLTGLLAGYAVHNIFVFDNLASYAFFFALLSLALMLKNSEAKTLFGDKSVGNDAIEYVVAPIVIVALLAGIYFWNVRPIQANTGLIVALRQCQQGGSQDVNLFNKVFAIDSYMANQEAREQTLSCATQVIGSQAAGPTKQAFFSLAGKAIEDQIAATPKDARIYTLAGSFLSSVGQSEKAIPILDTAHTLSPGKQGILFDLATSYLNTGKPDKAIELAKQAYELATEYPQARLVYASVLIYAKKEALAREIFADDPSVFESDTVARVFISTKQYDKAIAIYKKAVANNPTNLQALGQLAQAQYTAGLINDAIETLNTVAKTYPEYASQIEATIKQMREEAAKR